MIKRLETLTDLVAILAGLSAIVIIATLVSQRVVRNDPDSSDREITSVGVVEEWERYASASHRIGSATAPTTIIEFGDYQCSFCRDWQPHIEAILRKYPDDVAFVFRHFPLSDFSYAAARAAECAGEQGRFWPFHRELLANTNWFAIERFAVTAGVQDMDAFDACLADESPVPSIENDLAAAMELGAQGTPTILVNGVMAYGVVDSLELETAIRRVAP